MNLGVVRLPVEGVLARRVEVVLDEPVHVVADRQRVLTVLRHRHLDDVPRVLDDERRRRVVEHELGQVRDLGSGDVHRRLAVTGRTLLERLVDLAPAVGPSAASTGSWFQAGASPSEPPPHPARAAAA